VSGASIYLVRHGQTEWSANGRHTSRTDLPLLESGREQAEVLGARLSSHPFALVLTSPMRRARETCELAGFGEVAQIEDGLREWDYGEYEGLTTPEIREQIPSWDLWRDGCPGGEMPEQIGARVDKVLARMRAADGDVLAFAHGHSLRVLTARWLGMEPAGGSYFVLSAGGIGVLGFERKRHVLEQWNA
jgi:probable phosphoglycerate mutase